MEQVKTKTVSTTPAAPEHELVPRQGAAEVQPHWNGVSLHELTPDTPATHWPTSLDARTPSGRALMFAAGNPADFSVPLGGKVDFFAVDWLVYCEEKEDADTGELKPVGVLVLFNKEGKTLKSWSQYAPRRLKAALELYSREEWQLGIHFAITDRASKRPGRHYHDVRVIAE